jgi:hypothetical protein
MTTQPNPPQQATALPGPREQFLRSYEREHATTMRVLRGCGRSSS